MMPPEQGAPAPDQQQPDQQKTQGLLVGIHNGLLKFKDLLSSTPEIPDQVKAQLDGVIQGYTGVLDAIKSVGQGGEQPPAQPQAAPASGPAPVSKGPVPMNGGKGAVPAM